LEANRVPQREHWKIPLATRRRVTVEQRGHADAAERTRSISTTLRRIRIP
jgi:hypothetical protein